VAVGVDEYHRFQELIRPPAGVPLMWPVWDSDAWEAANRRFSALIDVWFHTPLSAAGFRGKSPRWTHGSGSVRAVVDLQRSDTAQFEGLIDFTANWGIWVEGFARRVSKAKRPTPRTTQSPFASRIGRLLGSGEYDVWWAVTPERVVRHIGPVVEESDPPGPEDEVPSVVRSKLIPMLKPIDSVGKATEAIEGWIALGHHSSVYWMDDPLSVLRNLAGR